MGYLEPIVFVIFIVYAILAGSFYKVGNNIWNNIYPAIAGLITLLSLGYYTFKEDKERGLHILLLLVLIGGYVFICWNMNLINTKKDDKNIKTIEDNYSLKTLTSTIAFIFVGIIAWYINRKETGNSCENSSELLCNFNIILLFIISSISIYQFTNWLRLKKVLFLDDSNELDKSSYITFTILILCLWQFYIYFLVDGFRDGRIIPTLKQMGSGDSNSMYEVFSFLSIIILIGFGINNYILSTQCRDWYSKNMVNHIRELSYNMIGTTITSIIIIMVLSGRL